MVAPLIDNSYDTWWIFTRNCNKFVLIIQLNMNLQYYNRPTLFCLTAFLFHLFSSVELLISTHYHTTLKTATTPAIHSTLLNTPYLTFPFPSINFYMQFFLFLYMYIILLSFYANKFKHSFIFRLIAIILSTPRLPFWVCILYVFHFLINQ